VILMGPSCSAGVTQGAGPGENGFFGSGPGADRPRAPTVSGRPVEEEEDLSWR
jgi:hypothetical protein